MAVTIDEMRVDVHSSPPQSSTPSPPAEPKKEKDLRESLNLLHERKLRLRAD